MASEGYIYTLLRGLITNRDQQSNRKYLTWLLVRILCGHCDNKKKNPEEPLGVDLFGGYKVFLMEIFLKQEHYLT